MPFSNNKGIGRRAFSSSIKSKILLNKNVFFVSEIIFSNFIFLLFLSFTVLTRFLGLSGKLFSYLKPRSIFLFLFNILLLSTNIFRKE
jgi:hypothetical protein